MPRLNDISYAIPACLPQAGGQVGIVIPAWALPAAGRRKEYVQRIPIEGKFGQGKNGYRLNYIRAKRSDTSTAWINSIFLVMNLLILLKAFYLLLKKFRAGARYGFLNRIAMCIG